MHMMPRHSALPASILQPGEERLWPSDPVGPTKFLVSSMALEESIPQSLDPGWSPTATSLDRRTCLLSCISQVIRLDLFAHPSSACQPARLKYHQMAVTYFTSRIRCMCQDSFSCAKDGMCPDRQNVIALQLFQEHCRQLAQQSRNVVSPSAKSTVCESTCTPDICKSERSSLATVSVVQQGYESGRTGEENASLK